MYKACYVMLHRILNMSFFCVKIFETTAFVLGGEPQEETKK